MKVYQTIHKYAPHIPIFEKKHGIDDSSVISFLKLQQLLIEDGYAAAYILEPALNGKSDEVFYTLWNYERLQFQWAKEHGIESTDLSVIKKAQMDWFKPDVFYNLSPSYDNNFVDNFKLDPNITTVCWYSIIGEKPAFFHNYDITLSLHQPFVEQWRKTNIAAFEFQPSMFNFQDEIDSVEKTTDFMSYGQTASNYFKGRNDFFEKLLAYSTDFEIAVHLQIHKQNKSLINFPGFRKLTLVNVFPTKNIKKFAKNPLYGIDLYKEIAKSKYTINTYGDFNSDFKSNMRLFESISCGSILVSEEGNYPEGFIDGKNYISYKNAEDLFTKLPSLVKNYSQISKEMEPYITELKEKYSKTNQWLQFQEIVNHYNSKK